MQIIEGIIMSKHKYVQLFESRNGYKVRSQTAWLVGSNPLMQQQQAAVFQV